MAKFNFPKLSFPDDAIETTLSVALKVAKEIKDEIQNQKMANYIESVRKYKAELESGIINRDEVIEDLTNEIKRLRGRLAKYEEES